MGPAARLLIEEHHLDPAVLRPSGPKGWILKGDVLEYLLSGSSSRSKPTAPAPVAAARVVVEKSSPVVPVVHVPAPATPKVKFTDEPTSTIRKVIAKRLSESKSTIPHYYVSGSAPVDTLLELRASTNKKLAENGEKTKVSVNDFIIKVVAVALAETGIVPLSPNGVRVDVSVAVATDSGLFTPVIRAANLKSLSQIAHEMQDFAAKAKSNTLQPEEYTGGHITISNLGMMGINSFSAIINPPQSCIVAIGKTEEKVAATQRPDGSIELKVLNQLSFTFSCDIRSLPEDLASRFMQIFQQKLESPSSIIL